jgi:hypothetical protein
MDTTDDRATDDAATDGMTTSDMSPNDIPTSDIPTPDPSTDTPAEGIDCTAMDRTERAASSSLAAMVVGRTRTRDLTSAMSHCVAPSMSAALTRTPAMPWWPWREKEETVGRRRNRRRSGLSVTLGLDGAKLTSSTSAGSSAPQLSSSFGSLYGLSFEGL